MSTLLPLNNHEQSWGLNKYHWLARNCLKKQVLFLRVPHLRDRPYLVRGVHWSDSDSTAAAHCGVI